MTASAKSNSKTLSQRQMNNEGVIGLNYMIKHGNDESEPYSLTDISSNFIIPTADFDNILTRYKFGTLPEIYKSIISDARVLPYNELFMHLINDFYNKFFHNCLFNFYNNSPMFFNQLFPVNTANSYKHLSFQKFYYLICIIDFVNKYKDDEKMKDIKEPQYTQIVSWCLSRYDPNMEFHIIGPMRNQMINLDYVSYYSMIISTSNSKSSITEQQSIIKLGNIADNTLEFIDTLQKRPNVYDKNPDTARQYVITINTKNVKNKFIDKFTNDNRLIFDLSYIDMSSPNQESTASRLEDIRVMDREFNTTSKLNVKTLESVFNSYSRLAISNLTVNQFTYNTDLSFLDEVYVVFKGVEMSKRTLNNGKYGAEGDLAVVGRFEKDNNDNYKFIPFSDFTTYEKGHVRCKQCQLYLTTDLTYENNLLSPNLINLKVNRGDFLNTKLYVVDKRKLSTQIYGDRFNQFGQFPDLYINEVFNRKQDANYVNDINYYNRLNFHNSYLNPYFLDHAKYASDAGIFDAGTFYQNPPQEAQDIMTVRMDKDLNIVLLYDYVHDKLVNKEDLILYDEDTNLINFKKLNRTFDTYTREEYSNIIYTEFMNDKYLTTQNRLYEPEGKRYIDMEFIEPLSTQNISQFTKEDIAKYNKGKALIDNVYKNNYNFYVYNYRTIEEKKEDNTTTEEDNTTTEEIVTKKETYIQKLPLIPAVGTLPATNDLEHNYYDNYYTNDITTGTDHKMYYTLLYNLINDRLDNITFQLPNDMKTKIKIGFGDNNSITYTAIFENETGEIEERLITDGQLICQLNYSQNEYVDGLDSQLMTLLPLSQENKDFDIASSHTHLYNNLDVIFNFSSTIINSTTTNLIVFNNDTSYKPILGYYTQPVTEKYPQPNITSNNNLSYVVKSIKNNFLVSGNLTPFTDGGQTYINNYLLYEYSGDYIFNGSYFTLEIVNNILEITEILDDGSNSYFKYYIHNIPSNVSSLLNNQFVYFNGSRDKATAGNNDYIDIKPYNSHQQVKINIKLFGQVLYNEKIENVSIYWEKTTDETQQEFYYNNNIKQVRIYSPIDEEHKYYVYINNITVSDSSPMHQFLTLQKGDGTRSLYDTMGNRILIMYDDGTIKFTADNIIKDMLNTLDVSDSTESNKELVFTNPLFIDEYLKFNISSSLFINTINSISLLNSITGNNQVLLDYIIDTYSDMMNKLITFRIRDDLYHLTNCYYSTDGKIIFTHNLYIKYIDDENKGYFQYSTDDVYYYSADNLTLLISEQKLNIPFSSSVVDNSLTGEEKDNDKVENIMVHNLGNLEIGTGLDSSDKNKFLLDVSTQSKNYLTNNNYSFPVLSRPQFSFYTDTNKTPAFSQLLGSVIGNNLIYQSSDNSYRLYHVAYKTNADFSIEDFKKFATENKSDYYRIYTFGIDNCLYGPFYYTLDNCYYYMDKFNMLYKVIPNQQQIFEDLIVTTFFTNQAFVIDNKPVSILVPISMEIKKNVDNIMLTKHKKEGELTYETRFLNVKTMKYDNISILDKKDFQQVLNNIRIEPYIGHMNYWKRPTCMYKMFGTNRNNMLFYHSEKIPKHDNAFISPNDVSKETQTDYDKQILLSPLYNYLTEIITDEYKIQNDKYIITFNKQDLQLTMVWD